MAADAERRERTTPAPVAASPRAPVPGTDGPATEPEAARPPDPIATPAAGRWRALVLGGLLAAIGIGWVAWLAGTIATFAPPGALTPLRIAAWIGLGSGPLALLAILAVLMLRTGAVEAGAFARRARTLRDEADRLAALVALVGERVDGATRDLAARGTALADLGGATADRLDRADAALRDRTEGFARAAAALDDATAAARADMGVLLTDLPGAIAQAEGLGAHVRAIGEGAADGAGLLAERLALLDARARAADEGGTAAARRLATELERVDAGAAAADRRVGEVVDRLALASDAALARAAEGLEEIRRGIGDQGAALAAMVAQAAASAQHAGGEGARDLRARLDALDQRLMAVATGLREQEGAARGLLGQLDQAVGAMETRIAGLGDTGAAHVADLAEAIVRLSEHADGVGAALGQGAEFADRLAASAGGLRETIVAGNDLVAAAMPDALGRLRGEIEAGGRALATSAAATARLLADAEAVNARLSEADRLVAAQEAAIARVADADAARLARLAAQLDAIAEAAGRGDGALRALADVAPPALEAALERVREAADAAAALARDAFARALPDAADALATTAAREVTRALGEVGRTELAQVGVASAGAMEAARGATERLTRQLLTIAEATRALEARIADQALAAQAADEDGFARQAGLLIEALNSTAIDVAKLFSNDVTDVAWAAYLKGDRGVFTRRAVRLLEQGEARVIGERYRGDPEFHGQVDRYVHDFESLLRRLTSARGGEAMSVALVSSDIGKLYVALAQAIDRLRR